MNFKVFHIQGLPIEPEHRKLAQKEWKEYASVILEKKPEKDDLPAWENLNNLLNVKEDELKAKYPSQTEWAFSSLDELVEKVKKEGSLSFCEENGETVIYIMSKYEE